MKPTEEGAGQEQQQHIEGAVEPQEGADEFQYAFEGKSREGKFHVMQFKGCPPPQGLLTDIQNNPLEAVLEEEEHEIHIPVPCIQGGGISELVSSNMAPAIQDCFFRHCRLLHIAHGSHLRNRAVLYVTCLPFKIVCRHPISES